MRFLKHILAVLIAVAVMAGTARAGEWKTHVEQVYDDAKQQTVNRTYRVWDPSPERNLDFEWRPDNAMAEYPDGAISGSGTLTWRRRDAQAYSKSAEVSVYKGNTANGRPEGKGEITFSSGFRYNGDWHDGLPDGHGAMHFANGDDYEGELRAGQPDGTGRYASADGSVYIGSFRDGKRDGSGRVTMADGREFQTEWSAGKLTQDPTPVGNAASPPVGDIGTRPDGLSVRVLVDRLKNQQIQEDETYFVYDAERQAGVMNVSLAAPAIMRVWKGDGVLRDNVNHENEAAFDGAEEFAPVFLAADIENGSSRPVRITDAYLTMIESATDLEPFLEAFSGTEKMVCGMVHYEPRISFRNDGWGPVQGASLNYSLGTDASRVGPFTAQIGDFADTRTTSVESALIASKVRVDRLRSHQYACGSMDAIGECLKRIEASGDLGALADHVFINGSDVYANLDGRLDYDWTDVAGTRNHRTSPVSIDVPLFHIKVVEAECGGGAPTERTDRVITLLLDRKNYRLPLNWHADLRPREDKRFAFSLVAPKSSHHRFRLTVDLSDGSSLNSLLVDLTYFRPRKKAQ